MSSSSPFLYLLQRFVQTDRGFVMDRLRHRHHESVSLSNGEIRPPKESYSRRCDVSRMVHDLKITAYLADAPDLSFITCPGGDLGTAIHTVDRNLIVITTSDSGWSSYLICDAFDRSLSVVPFPPSLHGVSLRSGLLVARLRDDDRSYGLVIWAKVFSSFVPKDVLIVSFSDPSSLPWRMRKLANFPSHWLADKDYRPDVLFSAGGRGYWVDLLCGVMYCNCCDVLSVDRESVEFCSIDLPLPSGDYLRSTDMMLDPRALRTMGCVGESIKFVSIDGFLEPVDLAERTVTVWKLKDMKWIVEAKLSLKTLWQQQKFKSADIPKDLCPMYPYLSPNEDGVIYFALGEYVQCELVSFPGVASHLLRIDMRREMLLDSKTLHPGTDVSDLIGLDSSLFKKCKAYGRRVSKRKLQNTLVEE